MANKLLEGELEDVLGTYTARPLGFEGVGYGNSYTSADLQKRACFTYEGEELCGNSPGLFAGVATREPWYTMARVPFGKGESETSVVYRLPAGCGTLAVKERDGHDDGMLTRMAEIGIKLRGSAAVGIPKLYFSTPNVLAMEYVDAPTLAHIEAGLVPGEDFSEVWEEYYESGAMEKLVSICGRGTFIKNDDVLVQKLESGKRRFVLIDQ